MNDIIKINKLLQKYSEGDKHLVYKKLVKILGSRKNDYQLRYNVAVIEQDLNLNLKAKENYKIIIQNQKNLKAMVNLYNIFIKEQNYVYALTLIEKVLRIDNTLEFAKKDMAFVFLKLRRINESKKICEILLKEDKKNTGVLNILGLCYAEENEIKKSEKIFKEILSYEDSNIAALNSLGRLNHEKRDSENAEKYFVKALQINPNSHEVLNNIAGFYREEGYYQKAISFYIKALKISPENEYILNNLAKSYFDISNLKKAKNYAIRALEINKQDGNIQKILSFIYLKNHEFNKGWSYFDGRLKLTDFAEKNSSIKKLHNKIYHNQKIHKNKRILILREQGVGDELLYATMYKDALINLPNVLIECDKRLLNLFKNSFKDHKNQFVSLGTISKNQSKLDKFDNVLYAGSLGKFFRKNKKDFIKRPYLIADQTKVSDLKKYVNKFENKFNIGFSWKSFKNRYANEKSLSLFDLNHFFNIKECNFYNLQYGDVRKEISDFINKTGVNIITNNEIDLFNDLDRLAAFLKNLDIFVTVSNSTAHLAGALGTKTLLIKPSNHALFHYWNQAEDKTPWYNSVKLINKKDLKNKKLINSFINY